VSSAHIRRLKMGRKEVDVLVVGSCNVDFITYTDRVPKIGETVEGVAFAIGNGGKGANQAYQAALLDASVAFVGRVGNDHFGQAFIDTFESVKVDTSHLKKTDTSTGSAQITVDRQSGDNSIIIVKGANDMIVDSDVEVARDAFKPKVVVCQNEIQLDTTVKALHAWKVDGAVVIFNPAPALPLPTSESSEHMLSAVDLLVPNESEAEVMAEMKVSSVDDAKQACDVLRKKGAKGVIMTMGGSGCYVSTPEVEKHIPLTMDDVKVVDSTGAGDSFCGALSSFLARGEQLENAVKKSMTVASYSVQRKGTQTSYHTRAELPSSLFD